MNDRPIYLDYHATTPLDPRVLEVMLPYFTQRFGNASSRSHRFGWEADAAVADARLRVAELLGAKSPDEIVFTSGATESNNLALLGVMLTAPRGHIITSSIEHPCVLETCRALERRGYTWTAVPVQPDGVIAVHDIEASIRPDTRLISVMAVNNEIGTIQPIERIAELAKRHGVLFHSDAAQAAGRIALSAHRASIDLMSVSAHKMYGPKGVGALYVRRNPRPVPLERQMHGGGQERGARSGTLNVPGIVGLGAAAALAMREGAEEMKRAAVLRDRLLMALRGALPDLRVYGSMRERVACNLNVSLGEVRGDTMLSALPGLALSGGAACASGKAEASHVLRAIGVSQDEANRALRIAIGRMTTEAEIELSAMQLISAAKRLSPKARAHAQTSAPTTSD